MTLVQSMLISACAILMSFSTTYLVRKFAFHYSIMDKPNPLIPQHTHAVPFLGGVGIFLSFNGILLILRSLDVQWASSIAHESILPLRIILPSSLALIFGVADDIRNFSPAKKMLLQLATAACAVSFGLTYSLTGHFLFDAVFSGVWILILMNAFNLTDVCDGLVAGIAVINFTFLHIYCQAYPTLSIIIVGSTLGFLIFNSPPASIFLGDAGSNYLGFMVAAIMLSSSHGRNAWPHIPIMILFAAVPLFELLFLVGVRIKKRIPWWKGSSDHFSLRLQARGMSKRKTIAIGWIASLLACGIALMIERMPLLTQILLFSLTIFASVRISFLLQRWEVRNTQSK